MMNEFGTPMNDAEMNMLPPGANKPHERMLAESGMEMQLIPAVIGAVLGGGAALGLGATATVALTAAGVGASLGGAFGTSRSASSAARKQAEQSNDATDRAHAYDLELWEMQKEKIVADRNQAVKVMEVKAANEGKVAAYTDLVNTERYNYEMQIRDRQQQSLDQQFAKSTDIYHRQLTLNERSAKAAAEDEYRAAEEINAEQRFAERDAYLEWLETEGEMRARMASGRGARKATQVSYYELGEKMSAINAALAGVAEGTESALQEIARDRSSADLAAEAQRMLDPGTLPSIPIPVATPMADYTYPRSLEDYDFGPEPVKGVYMSPSSAANQAWGNSITGIAGTVAGAMPMIGKATGLF